MFVSRSPDKILFSLQNSLERKKKKKNFMGNEYRNHMAGRTRCVQHSPCYMFACAFFYTCVRVCNHSRKIKAEDLLHYLLLTVERERETFFFSSRNNWLIRLRTDRTTLF